jgi:hypothetical protein
MRRLALAILLFALPGALTAQDARIERIRQAFPAEAVTRIEGILAQAQAAGVPTGPLIAKALEGAAKGVAADRVVAVLSSYSDGLRRSQVLIGPARGEAAVVAGADALRRGVPPQTVQALAGAHSGDLAVPLVVLGELMEAGVPVEHAYQVVQEALSKHQGPEEMLAIPGAVRRMMREGRTPAEAANAVGQAIGLGRFGGMMGPPGQVKMKGPPVPPGSGPPDHAAKKKGKGIGKPPPSGVL